MILHWFRRDLRLTDNPDFNAAAREANGAVLPVTILSSWSHPHPWSGPARQEALCQSIAALHHQLERRGSRLVINTGPPLEVLERLVIQSRQKGPDQITAIYTHRSPDPHGRALEAALERLAKRLGIGLRISLDHTVFPSDHPDLFTSSGTPYRVYTAFAKAWLRLTPPPPDTTPTPLKSVPTQYYSEPPPTLSHWGIPARPDLLPAGEPAARRRLKQFFSDAIYRYGKERDLPAAEATSRFSVDLRWGTLSIREIIALTRKAMAQAPNAAARKSAFTFLNELIWREFYFAILWHWPEVLKHEFAPQYRKLPWLYPGNPIPPILRGTTVRPDEAFRRWCDGETGFPIVDAAMRQLNTTGFMHNRLRMITAMFLTKDLHLDWRLGEQYFMQRLADGDIAANNGGWQWSAGTGADAAPYFRIQNPWTQTARFDPDGDFIRRWVPELKHLPARAFTKPPADGVRLAPNYPTPIINHAHERLLTLDQYRQV